MKRSIVQRLTYGGIVIAVALASLGQAAAQDELAGDLPEMDKVSVRMTQSFPDVGNALVTVHVSDAEREKLGQDFFSVGAGDDIVIFRDDGQGGDERAGDGVFTAIATVTDQDRAERTTTDRETDSAEQLVFSDRELVGVSESKRFDGDAFGRGAEITLAENVSPSTLSTTLGFRAAGVVVPGTNAFQEKVLMIRDLSVVQDPARTFDPCTGAGTPMGAWTFGRLITDMANSGASGIDPSVFVEDWLNNWLSAQTINTFNVASRLNMAQLIADWRAASGGGKLDLSIAPFRLLAIVPRLDLRQTVGGGGYSGPAGGNQFLDAGEARFVFGVVIPKGYTDVYIASSPIPSTDCSALRFSVIVEYGVPKCRCEDVRGWARQWIRLNSLPLGSPAYLARLERLTRQFARANANPLKPNGSALNQLRTNEIALAFPWNLREFRLTVFPFSMFQETTVADTPHISFNNSPTITSYMLSGLRPAPLLFGGVPFLSGDSPVPNPAFFWNGAPPLNPGGNPAHNQARFDVSFRSCSGCHGGETSTVFVHVEPQDPVLPANLSGFLTGISVPDPAVGAPVRNFDDLARREKDIKKLAKILCFRFRRVHVSNVLAVLKEQRRLPFNLFEGLSPLPVEQRLSLSVEDLVKRPAKQIH